MNRPIRIAVNGFGRMGRLAMRAGSNRPDIEFIHINEPFMDAETAAHLLAFDSVHGRWDRAVAAEADALAIDGRRMTLSAHEAPGDIPWGEIDCDLVLECSGRFRDRASLQPHLDGGAKRVIVSAPVKDTDVPNVVMGVNDGEFDLADHSILSAASCTTNCLAPMVKVVHERFGIRHGVVTTIHDATNTQRVLDGPHKDLRRARASGLSLIPTTTGSAKAITRIFPELEGKLNGLAVRVPLFNASITDTVLELENETTAEAVNEAFRDAADNELKGIFGYETRPLVSVDFRSDSRSGVLDAPSTMVVDGTQLKLLAWYDNEYGYVHRMIELAVRAEGSAR